MHNDRTADITSYRKDPNEQMVIHYLQILLANNPVTERDGKVVSSPTIDNIIKSAYTCLVPDEKGEIPWMVSHTPIEDVWDTIEWWADNYPVSYERAKHLYDNQTLSAWGKIVPKWMRRVS